MKKKFACPYSCIHTFNRLADRAMGGAGRRLYSSIARTDPLKAVGTA